MILPYWTQFCQQDHGSVINGLGFTSKFLFTIFVEFYETYNSFR